MLPDGRVLYLNQVRDIHSSRFEISIAWPLGRMNGHLAEKGFFQIYVMSLGKRKSDIITVSFSQQLEMKNTIKFHFLLLCQRVFAL